MQDTHALGSTDTTLDRPVPSEDAPSEAPRARPAPGPDAGSDARSEAGPAVRIDADEHDVARLLGADGPIARELAGFRPRREQQHLAEAVAKALVGRTTLVGEAGTGTGKTFAYLVPAIVSGERTVISTGTRHLQDQLFRSDLPLVRRALGVDFDASLLKGRANYLCRERLARARSHPALSDPRSRRHLAIVEEWARGTDTGDVSEVAAVPEDSPVWSHVVSHQEACARHERDELEGCFVHRARRRAQEADVVVVNHHLLCADLALKEEGFGDLLPSADGFVIDEAHQLPDIAAEFFGRRLSSRQLLDLARDAIGEQVHEAPDFVELRERAQELETGVRLFRLAFGAEPTRDAWSEARGEPAVERELERMALLLGALAETLEEVAKRGKGLESCHKRALAHAATLEGFVDPPDGDEWIPWYETFRTGFALVMTPMTVAEPFRRAMAALPAGWVFTSATLAVGGDFGHFRSRLGLRECDELQVDSPFDYRRNALLYLPPALPEPQRPGYTAAVMEAVLPVLEASEGRAFLLFTSHRALKEAALLLEDRLPYPLLVQGQAAKRELLDTFRSLGNAVLLGTSSFWEGVDVRGEALSLVVIEKLPFGSPGDPVMKARIAHLKAGGGDPFHEFQVPQAAIALKQGVGRLIRDVTDRGVLVLCDPRVRSRPYGELFLTSLPQMPIATGLDEVRRFFARADADGVWTGGDDGAAPS